MTNEVVTFRELESVSDKKIGVAKLNALDSLNALTLDMVSLLFMKLDEWQRDSDIAIVVLEAQGRRAFCAGGDVVQLYKTCKGTDTGAMTGLISEFFRQEYELDYFIHTYNKPILVLGQGIVMGGGLGLMAGASHRVVTQTSLLAMPEITIGLFPDVGASYFLNRMPEGFGLFLGLTGAAVNPTDSKLLGLADHLIGNDEVESVIESLILTQWGDTLALNRQKLTDVLISFEQKSAHLMPDSQIMRHQDVIRSLSLQDGVVSNVVKVLDQATDDDWFKKIQLTLMNGSPLSMAIVHEQLSKSKDMSLEEVFKMEHDLAVHTCIEGDFVEGVRALLVDKDKNPQWLFENIHGVPQHKVKKLFEPI